MFDAFALGARDGGEAAVGRQVDKRQVVDDAGYEVVVQPAAHRFLLQHLARLRHGVARQAYQHCIALAQRAHDAIVPGLAGVQSADAVAADEGVVEAEVTFADSRAVEPQPHALQQQRTRKRLDARELVRGRVADEDSARGGLGWRDQVWGSRCQWANDCQLVRMDRDSNCGTREYPWPW